MKIQIMIQKKTDPPRLAGLKQPIIDLTSNDKMTFCLVEGGMQSGEPSVIIISEDNEGSICLQTSLDKFLAAAVGMKAAAESHLGWVEKEGYASLMPMSKEARKALLESIQKELLEWDDVDIQPVVEQVCVCGCNCSMCKNGHLAGAPYMVFGHASTCATNQKRGI